MAKNFKSKLAGQIGEHLVVAELERRGVIAAPFAGNVPDIDILAYMDGKSAALQVKAQRTGDVSVNARHYLNIRFDGDQQIIEGKTEIDRDLVFVLISIGDAAGEDVFYIFTQGDVQELVHDHYVAFLNKHNGIRPRNPQTTHCAYYLSDLEEYRDNWELVLARLER